MSQSSTCPRNRKGSFGIPHGAHVTVSCMDAESNASMFTCSNPVHEGGGVKQISISFLETYPFLLDFVEAKVFAALLLKSINLRSNTLYKNKMIYPKKMTILPKAVACELNVLEVCQKKGLTS